MILRIRDLLPDEVAFVGQLPFAVLLHWSEISSTRWVIRGERRGHLYANHPETEALLWVVIETMRDPERFIEIVKTRQWRSSGVPWTRNATI